MTFAGSSRMPEIPDMGAIADAMLDALRRREAELRDEQAVRGLDSLDEVELHPLLAEGLRGLGIGVLREQAYPHEWAFRSAPQERERTRDCGEPRLVMVESTDAFPETQKDQHTLPDPRDRQRCDLVITPRPGQALSDEVREKKAERKRQDEVRGTLFESLAPRPVELEAAETRGVPPEAAMWIEVKAVSQFDLSSGVPGFARSYASGLVKSLAGDLKKLESDPRVHRGAVLLVLFTMDRTTADHDLPLALHRCLDKGLSIGSPIIERFPITDRLGNALCSVCLVEMKRAMS